MNVTGFKMLFGKNFYEVAKTNRENLIGSNASIFLATKTKIGMLPTNTDDLYRNMIMNNKLTVTEFDEETGMGTCMFETPIPYHIYMEVNPDDDVITDFNETLINE